MTTDEPMPLHLAECFSVRPRVPHTLWDLWANFTPLGGKPLAPERRCGTMFRTTDGYLGIRNLDGELVVTPRDRCTHQQAALLLAHNRQWKARHAPPPITVDTTTPPVPLARRPPRPISDAAPSGPAGRGPMVTPELHEFAIRATAELVARVLTIASGGRIPRSRSWPKRPVPIKTNARRNRRRRNR